MLPAKKKQKQKPLETPYIALKPQNQKPFQKPYKALSTQNHKPLQAKLAKEITEYITQNTFPKKKSEEVEIHI